MTMTAIASPRERNTIRVLVGLSLVAMFFHTQNDIFDIIFDGDGDEFASKHKHKAKDKQDRIPAVKVKGNKGSQESQEYQPGSAEQYIVSNLDQLGLNKSNNPTTCQIWKDAQATTPEVFHSLAAYKNDLDRYNKMINNFMPVANTMEKIRYGGGDTEQSKICDSLRIHPGGIQGIFPSKQLSFTSSGYAEPLLPPMRSHKFCGGNRANLMSLDYLVHDFEFMCRNLKPTSKLVLLDLGASLSFHGTETTPIVTLMKQYEKFGFVFDHIYAFEVTKQDPEEVRLSVFLRLNVFICIPIE